MVQYPREPSLSSALSCLTVGWLLASTLTPPVARLQSLPERAQDRRHCRAESTFTEQLHFRLRQAPDPPQPRRNPFVSGSRPAPWRRPRPTREEPIATCGAAARRASDRSAVLVVGHRGHRRTCAPRCSPTARRCTRQAWRTVGGYTVVEITDDSVTLERCRHGAATACCGSGKRVTPVTAHACSIAGTAPESRPSLPSTAPFPSGSSTVTTPTARRSLRPSAKLAMLMLVPAEDRADRADDARAVVVHHQQHRAARAAHRPERR